MRKWTLLALTLFVVGCGSSSDSGTTATSTATVVPFAPPSLSQTQELDRAIQTAIDEEDLEGVIVSLRGPKIFYEKAFGVSNKETGQPLQLNEVMRIGSVTKTFTVTAVLQLADEGLVSLDDAISEYVSGVPSGDQITLRQLAAMQSGLFSFTDDEGFQDALIANPLRNFTPQEMLNFAFRHPNPFAPGTDFAYCNTNTVLLGLVVEKVTGLPLNTYLQQRIIGPLGMAQTALPNDGFLPDPHAHGYTEKFTPGNPVDATAWDPSWAGAAGAMYSRYDALQTWAVALGKGTLLRPETQAQRLKSVPFKDGPEGSTYGLGIINMTGWLGHGGNLPGYTSIVAWLPSQQTSLVILITTDTSKDPTFAPNLVVANAVTAVISPNHVIGETGELD